METTHLQNGEADAEPDQCIICFESLDAVASHRRNSLPSAVASEAAQVAPPAELGNVTSNNAHNHQEIGQIKTCSHVLHNDCLQAWIEKANSCPMCRQAFHQVDVLDKVGGTLLYSYAVEDKKQVAEFDPNTLFEQEEDPVVCPICGTADNEGVLLLCDGCDAAYHTYCVDLDRVPTGDWFCIECSHVGVTNGSADPVRPRNPRRRLRTAAQRTQAQVRRARYRPPVDEWQSAWNQFGGRVWDSLNLELDDYSDEDGILTSYRQLQRRTDRERREFSRWQQRLAIASRQGARDVFRDAARPVLAPPLRPKTPEPTPEESKAWEAFDHVREAENSGTNGTNGSSSRKRKTRSITRSPAEASAEPERKLKRPKTRRVINRPGSPSSDHTAQRNSNIAAPSPRTRDTASSPGNGSVPSFLTSLLREVEVSTSTDDESGLNSLSTNGASPSIEHSPAASPPSSNYSTPRALSTTPPPHRSKRPGSPLTLSSYVEPIYPPADYSPTPRPEESSPTRANLSAEAKEGINKIVRKALEPHYKKPDGITKEQYATVNRLVSRMLYEKISDPDSMDDEQRSAWQKVAADEVTRAVETLGA